MNTSKQNDISFTLVRKYFRWHFCKTLRRPKLRSYIAANNSDAGVLDTQLKPGPKSDGYVTQCDTFELRENLAARLEN